MVPARSCRYSSFQVVQAGYDINAVFTTLNFIIKVVFEIDSLTHVKILSVNANTTQPQIYVFIKAVRNRDPAYKDQV